MAGTTGFRDVIYDLVSAEYHALNGGYVCEQYLRDAEKDVYEGRRKRPARPYAEADAGYRAPVQVRP